MRNYKVIHSESLSKPYDLRYICVDPETGEILDDAQGYGYKSAQKAHAAFQYKNQSKAQKKAKAQKKKRVADWVKSHKDYTTAVEIYFDDMVHGCYDKFDTAAARKLLKELNYNEAELGFTATDLVKFYTS